MEIAAIINKQYKIIQITNTILIFMKTRNLFLSTLACASLLACSKDDDSSIQEVLSGDNYVAVNIVAPAGGTRALGGVDQGTAAESAVNSAIFFFFDSNGNGCANPNYIPTFTMTGNEEGSLSEAVLVLENPSAVPSSMVAIMNPTEKIIGLTASVSLSALKNQVDAYYTTGTTNFLMSNSVYVGANNTTVSSTAISPSQICSTKDEAKNSAVTIPVERLVAKVNANLGSVSGKETYMVNGEETILSINLIGWKATNLNPKSYLIKNVEGISVETWWNDVANLRSYWANSSTPDSYTNFSYEVIAGNKEPQYCLENTPPKEAPTEERTKLIVAAQVTDQAGNPVDLMEWRGEKYTSDDMKTRLAGFMKNYYTRTNTEVEGEYKYVSLSSNYITFTISASENTAETSYKVYRLGNKNS